MVYIWLIYGTSMDNLRLKWNFMRFSEKSSEKKQFHPNFTEIKLRNWNETGISSDFMKLV